jgi:hypothetical protein
MSNLEHGVCRALSLTSQISVCGRRLEISNTPITTTKHFLNNILTNILKTIKKFKPHGGFVINISENVIYLF